MKFLVTMKDPDHSTEGVEDFEGAQIDAEKLKAKFIDWDEYLTVEFDTETGTARVVPVERS